uniref:uncharacterized protein LOC120338490 n=1 Tax=Styela clava TaxID=7725 RepID=UPI001939A8E0|nr:uncharacterized protein LOC120338490 [Styela clava]
MSFPLQLEIVTTCDAKTKKSWRRVQWDGTQSENITLLGRRTIAQLNLVSGKKKRVDASIRKLLGKVVYINTSTSGECVVGMLQDGHLFRWRKGTRTITNIFPCPDFTPIIGEGDATNKSIIRRPRLFIGDDGNTILLFSRHSGVYIWRSVGFHNSGWTRVTIGNAAFALFSAKGVTLDAVFFNDEVEGSTCNCSFVSSSDNNLTVGTLSLRLNQQECPATYFLNKYPCGDFHPPCIPIHARKSLLPCWSRNGRILSVAVNQRMPSMTKILLIQPHTGAVISVGFTDVLKNAVAMSFWITCMSWTFDNLILACSTKQGAVLLVSSSGNILSLMAETLTENFGPGIFLPLEGLVGFRRPAVENLTRDPEDSTDTSMQSSIVPVKKRKPKFTVAAHPQLPILLCSDGRSVAAIKMINASQKHDIIVSNVAETVQRLYRIINLHHLQVNILDPLSYFLPSEARQENMTDKEIRWRKIIKLRHEKIYLIKDKNVTENAGQAAPVSFILQDSDHPTSGYTNTEEKSNDDVDDKDELQSLMQVSAINLLAEIATCRTKILSILTLMLVSSEEKQNQNNDNRTQIDADVNDFTENELKKMFMLTIKLYCDILLQLEDVVDLLPYEPNTSSTTRTTKPLSLRELICDAPVSLGRGIVSLILWNEMTHSESTLISMIIFEIVNTLLMSSRKSSEGCLGNEDIAQNIHRTFLFLIRSESFMTKKSRFHCNSSKSDIISSLQSVEHVNIDPNPENENMDVASDPEENNNDVETSETTNSFYFTLSWKLLGEHVMKFQMMNQNSKNELPLIDAIVSYIQIHTSKQLVPIPCTVKDDKILTTRNIVYMCNCLSNYDICNALSSAYAIVSSQLTNTSKWTDEKWSPVEMIAQVMASYFCGSEVLVPTCMTSISKDVKYGGVSNSHFDQAVRLEQKLIISAVRDHSLDESWNINTAILLLLSCGQIKQASLIAFSVGDWRSALTLSALHEKTSFFETDFATNSLYNAVSKSDKIDISVLLKNRLADIFSMLFGVKVHLEDDNSPGIIINDDAKYLGLDPTLYTKCLSDFFKVSVMVGENVTSWSTCAMLGALKMKCTNIISLVIDNNIRLPHPQLYLPQSVTQTLGNESEVKTRMEIAGMLRTLLTMLQSIGITRVVAQWYLKWLDRETSCDHPHHESVKSKNLEIPKGYSLADNDMLKDVITQGLELNLVSMHGDASHDAIYILATVFREICAILWMFHVRDKLAVALRKYQELRDKLSFLLQDGGDSRDINEMQIMMEKSIHDCLFWTRKMISFAKFMRFEAEIEDLILCLVTELPLSVETANLIAEFFHDDNFTTPKNKHKMQVVMERMRKVQIVNKNDPTTKPLSAIFNEERQRLKRVAAAKKDALSRGSHFSLPRTSMTDIMKSLPTEEADSRTNTLTRDEPSQIYDMTPNDLLKTLDKCYAFESDNLYHKYILEFLEIILNKSPPSKTFTPKKEKKSRIISRPLSYPLVLTYRNEIAKAELEMIPPYDGQKVTPLTMTVPIPKYAEPSLDSEVDESIDTVQTYATTDRRKLGMTYFSDIEKKCEAEIFGLNHAKEKCDFTSVLRELPHMRLDDASPSFRKRLARLMPYFAWLEHWRTEVINVPQKHQYSLQQKSGMRVTISTEHLVHGFTVAEFRFGKKVKFKTTKRDESVTSTLVSEEVDGHSQISESEISEITPIPEEETDIGETKPHSTFDQLSQVVEQDIKDETKSEKAIEKQSAVKIGDAPDTLKTVTPITDVSKHSEKQKQQDETELGIEDLKAPDVSAGNILRKMGQKEPSEEIAHEIVSKAESVTGVASHSVVSVSSTGLQSDIMPDGGGKFRGSRLTKKKDLEKLELQHLIRNEMQSVMVGHQVFILAQILQSIALHVSTNQSHMTPTPTPQQHIPLQQQQQSPPQKLRKNDGRLQMLTLDGQSSYVFPDPKPTQRQSRQSRAPLKILSENRSLLMSHTRYLHDESNNVTNVHPSGKSASQVPPPVPVMYDERKVPHYGTINQTKPVSAPQEKPKKAKFESSVLTADMLESKQPTHEQQSVEKGACPTCHSHSEPKQQTSRLPLLQLAGIRGARSKASSAPGMPELPQLVGLRQLLRYEQKRMEKTQLQSQSVRNIPQLPLLDATKIPGFYQLKPKIREIPVFKPTNMQQQRVHFKEPEAQNKTVERLRESGVPPEDQEDSHETPRLKIPSELLPRVLSQEEADKIRNGVLAHYKIVADQQKAMLREAGQQTVEIQEKPDKFPQHLAEEPYQYQEPIRLPKKHKIDKYEMHEDFAQRFLSVEERERSTASSINTTSDKIRAEKVARIQGPDKDQIPAMQKMVESRWSSAMNQMSSEVEAISGIDRDLRYRRYEDEMNGIEQARPPVIPHDMQQIHLKSASQSSIQHDDRSQSTTVHSTHSERETYIPKPGIIGEIGERIRREKFEPAYVQRRSAFETDFMKYRKKIDEALQLADPGLYREKSDSSLRSSRHTAAASSSLQKMDDTMLSSLSWDELEAMITESVLMDAGTDGGDWTAEMSSVDARIQDSLQLLNELQTDQQEFKRGPKKDNRVTKQQKVQNAKKSKKHAADVDARINDALSLLGEIKNDQRQIKTGQLTMVKSSTPSQKGLGKSKGVDNWTMEAMDLLNELKTEFEPSKKVSAKENYPPTYTRKSDSENMRAHIEEAMALLRDDNTK